MTIDERRKGQTETYKDHLDTAAFLAPFLYGLPLWQPPVPLLNKCCKSYSKYAARKQYMRHQYTRKVFTATRL